jgi:hypothetical protein
MTRIGQKTGTSKNLKKVMSRPIDIDLIDESLRQWRVLAGEGDPVLMAPSAHQNLNSGSLRTKGLNSSFDEEGSEGPSLSGSN